MLIKRLARLLFELECKREAHQGPAPPPEPVLTMPPVPQMITIETTNVATSIFILLSYDLNGI